MGSCRASCIIAVRAHYLRKSPKQPALLRTADAVNVRSSLLLLFFPLSCLKGGKGVALGRGIILQYGVLVSSYGGLLCRVRYRIERFEYRNIELSICHIIYRAVGVALGTTSAATPQALSSSRSDSRSRWRHFLLEVVLPRWFENLKMSTAGSKPVISHSQAGPYSSP